MVQRNVPDSVALHLDSTTPDEEDGDDEEEKGDDDNTRRAAMALTLHSSAVILHRHSRQRDFHD